MKIYGLIDKACQLIDSPDGYWDKLDDDHQDEEEWQDKVENGERFTCKLCQKTTHEYNFINMGPTQTSPNKMWCIECEEWWNGGLGYELTYCEYRRRKINILYKTLPDGWRMARCNKSDRDYFYDMNNGLVMWEHPLYEDKLNQLRQEIKDMELAYNLN